MLLYCGTTAYTWKTAFDVEFSKFSPGALLVDKMTEQLFADGDIEAIESCSPEGGFMNQIWDGRRATVDLLADVGRTKSLGFHAVVARRARLRATARMAQPIARNVLAHHAQAPWACRVALVTLRLRPAAASHPSETGFPRFAIMH